MAKDIRLAAGTKEPRIAFIEAIITKKADPDISRATIEKLNELVRRANGISGAFVCASDGNLLLSDTDADFVDADLKIGIYKYLTKAVLWGVLQGYHDGLTTSIRVSAADSTPRQQVGTLQHLIMSLGIDDPFSGRGLRDVGLIHLDPRACTFLVVLGWDRREWEAGVVAHELKNFGHSIGNALQVPQCAAATTGY